MLSAARGVSEPDAGRQDLAAWPSYASSHLPTTTGHSVILHDQWWLHPYRVPVAPSVRLRLPGIEIAHCRVTARSEPTIASMLLTAA